MRTWDITCVCCKRTETLTLKHVNADEKFEMVEYYDCENCGARLCVTTTLIEK